NGFECASACALIWFGGVDRSGQAGLHRPWINDPRFRELSPPEASTAYRQVLAVIETYLNDMEVPKSIIELMVTTSSGDIRWVDSIDNRAALERPPSIAEWEDASCGFKGTFSSPSWDTATMLKWFWCIERLLANRRDRMTAPST